MTIHGESALLTQARLTPGQVESYVFGRTRWGGLDQGEVRDFQDRVRQELETLQAEKDALQAENDRLKTGGPLLPDTRTVFLLRRAQQTADNLIQDAQARAYELAADGRRRREELISDARTKATAVLRDALEEAEREARKISDAAPAEAQARMVYLQSFAKALHTLLVTTLNGLAATLQEMESDISGADLTARALAAGAAPVQEKSA